LDDIKKETRRKKQGGLKFQKESTTRIKKRGWGKQRWVSKPRYRGKHQTLGGRREEEESLSAKHAKKRVRALCRERSKRNTRNDWASDAGSLFGFTQHLKETTRKASRPQKQGGEIG